jgi:hypothetical protein
MVGNMCNVVEMYESKNYRKLHSDTFSLELHLKRKGNRENRAYSNLVNDQNW